MRSKKKKVFANDGGSRAKKKRIALTALMFLAGFAVATTARIASSDIREMMRAAQKVSSGRALRKAGFGYSGFQFSGVKKSDSYRPTDGRSGYFARSHGRMYKPIVASVRKVGRASQMYSWLARAVCACVLPLPSVDPKSSR